MGGWSDGCIDAVLGGGGGAAAASHMIRTTRPCEVVRASAHECRSLFGELPGTKYGRRSAGAVARAPSHRKKKSEERSGTETQKNRSTRMTRNTAATVVPDGRAAKQEHIRTRWVHARIRTRGVHARIFRVLVAFASA